MTTGNSDKAIVSIHQARDYSEENVQRAVDACLEDLDGIESFIKSGDRVLIKPNFLVGKPPDKALNTHYAVVRAVMQRVADCGARMTIGDSPSFGSARAAAKKCGILEVADHFGCEIITFKEVQQVPAVEGRMYKQLSLAKDALEADKVINLPKLKTHGFMTLTLGVKNLFGCIVGKAKPQWHLKAGQNPVAFARMLVEIDAAVAPALTVMDGIVAMEGNGPSSGDLKHVGAIMASSNAMALDRVTLEIIRVSPRRIPLIDAAREFGLKTAELDNIQIRGESVSSLRVKRFVLPPEPVSRRRILPRGLQRFIKRGFTSEPTIDQDKCTRCGTCQEACPPEIISLIPLRKVDRAGNDKSIEIDRTKCIHCFCCQEVCPEGAIAIRKGLFLRGTTPN